MTENACFLYNNCNHKDCESSFCLRKYKMTELYNLSLIPPTLRDHITLHVDADGTDYDQFKQFSEIEKDIVNFVKAGKNLYIHSSNCGNGKTSMSLRLAESFINKIWPKSAIKSRVLFISVPRFLLELKSNISKPSDYIDFIEDNVLEADLVIWDDIAAKISSDYEISHLLSIIDNRITKGGSNIYTSNLSPAEIERALGARLASRVCNYSIEIELHGLDKRKILQNK